MCPLLPKYSSRTSLGRRMLESEFGKLLGLCELKSMEICLSKFYLEFYAKFILNLCSWRPVFNWCTCVCVYSKQRPKRAFLHWEFSVDLESAERTDIHPYHVHLRWHWGCLWNTGLSKFSFCSFYSYNFHFLLTRTSVLPLTKVLLSIKTLQTALQEKITRQLCCPKEMRILSCISFFPKTLCSPVQFCW